MNDDKPVMNNDKPVWSGKLCIYPNLSAASDPAEVVATVEPQGDEWLVTTNKKVFERWQLSTAHQTVFPSIRKAMQYARKVTYALGRLETVDGRNA